MKKPTIHVHDFECEQDFGSRYVDSSTLEMSIDNGNNWYSMEQVADAFALLRVRNAMIEYDNRLARKRGEGCHPK